MYLVLNKLVGRKVQNQYMFNSKKFAKLDKAIRQLNQLVQFSRSLDKFKLLLYKNCYFQTAISILY